MSKVDSRDPQQERQSAPELAEGNDRAKPGGSKANASLRLGWMLLPFLMFVVLSALLFARLDKDPNELPSARIGKPLPHFDLPSLVQSNERLTPAAFLGQPFLVNVWATWCPSCRVEHGTLLELAKQGIAIVGVNYKDERPAALLYLKAHGDPFTWSVFDADGQLGLDLGVYGAPETFFVDAAGIIRYRHVGALTQSVWDSSLKTIYHGLQQANPG